MLQVVVDPSKSKPFCPMLLLMLLAVISDVSKLITEINEEPGQKMFCKGLLEKPTFQVSCNRYHRCQHNQ